MEHKRISDVAFSPAVKKWQEKEGSREAYERMEQKGAWRDTITPDLAAFIAARNSFYLGTASADGQPYIQHRGGKKGFLKVLDNKTLAFADFSGNKQFISAGNLAENKKAYIFLMDYANRRRIKIWGEVRVIEDDSKLLERVIDEDYKARPERVMVFKITVWDINCPQHIPVKLEMEEVEEIIEPFKARIAELEAEIKKLKT